MKVLIERFMGRVVPEPSTGCWIWGAAIGSHGYGDWYVGGGKRFSNSRADFEAGTGRVCAHVAAWALFKNNGVLPDKGVLVLHACDNRFCCAPHHLSVGSHSTNLVEAYRRTRVKKPLSMTKNAQYTRAYRERKRARAMY